MTDVLAAKGVTKRFGGLVAVHDVNFTIPEGSQLVGFALETGDAVNKGRAKLERKELDMIVVNDALKLAKKQKSNVSLEEVDESVTQVAKWLIDPDFSPEQLVEQKEVSENILKAIQSLSPEQGAVIVMRYFLDMSEADMSKKMDRPLSTVKWWLRDARKRLRDLIDEYFMRGVNYE